LAAIAFFTCSTLEEGNDIVLVTFFATKPPKKAQVAIFFFSKTIEEGDGSCLLLRYQQLAKRK
jgi:hypothetical protein